jgi:hypothetical protein
MGCGTWHTFCLTHILTLLDGGHAWVAWLRAQTRARMPSSMSTRWGGRLRQMSNNLRDRLFGSSGGSSGSGEDDGTGFAPLGQADAAPARRQRQRSQARPPLGAGVPMVPLSVASRGGTSSCLSSYLPSCWSRPLYADMAMAARAVRVWGAQRRARRWSRRRRHGGRPTVLRRMGPRPHPTRRMAGRAGASAVSRTTRA